MAVPDWTGTGVEERSVSALFWPGFGARAEPSSFMSNSLYSLDRIREREEPRDVLGDSVFRILEL